MLRIISCSCLVMTTTEPIRLKIDEPIVTEPRQVSVQQPKSVDFGGGVELLMNKKRPDSPKVGNVSALEAELNSLAEVPAGTPASDTVPLKPPTGDPEPIKLTPIETLPEKVIIGEDPQIAPDAAPVIGTEPPPDIARATAASAGDAAANASKSWGAFSMFGGPKDPDRAPPSPPPMSREEECREKFRYLRRLQDLEKKGVTLSKRHTMESPLAEMRGEYELCVSERERANSVRFQGKMLMAAVTGLEYLNGKFDPFDVKLDGWAEQLGENLTDYDEIFAELHEKYKSKAKMAPELKLLFQLGGSAIMVHMTNTMFKSSLPGMDDIMRQNPELMRQFTQAAVNSVSESSPGLGGFMGSFARPDPVPEPGDGPPPPVDASMRPTPRFMSDAGTGEELRSVGAEVETTTRPEMRGPSGIDAMLAQLKPVANPRDPADEAEPLAPASPKEASSISVAELKELNATASATRAKRRKGANQSNTISLNM